MILSFEMQDAFGVGKDFITSTHNTAKQLAVQGSVVCITKDVFIKWSMSYERVVKPVNAPLTFDVAKFVDSLSEEQLIEVRCQANTKIMSHREFEADKSLHEEDVILPDDVIVSTKAYLASLQPTDMVTVLVAVRHGLAGKESNRALKEAKESFMRFVKEHRQPTGRTLQSDGRYHGAEFYLNSNFMAIKQQTGNNRKQLPASQVLSSAFNAAISPSRSLGDTTIMRWFRSEFNIGSQHGHTKLFPHKSDACSRCEELLQDMRSVEASLRKHKLHVEDAGSLQRLTAVRELEVQLQELHSELMEHRAEAAMAQSLHKARTSTTRRNYTKVCLAFLELLESSGDAANAHEECEESFLNEAVKFEFSIDSDYQQDKVCHRMPMVLVASC